MNKRAPKLIASAFLVVTLATACGGGGRPSQDEIADGITDNSGEYGEVTEDVADCMAKAIHDSDLSDDAVRAVADGDEDYDPSDEDQKASEGLAGDILDCAGDLEMPDLEDLPTPSS